jgi:hypothetical protein
METTSIVGNEQKTRMMNAAKLREGKEITPCIGKTFDQCFTRLTLKKRGKLVLFWYNVEVPFGITTHMIVEKEK